MDKDFTNTEETKPRIKAAIIALCVFLVLATVIFFLLGRKETAAQQNLDDQEPALEYVAEDSRIAGIHFLLEYGLTRDKFDSVCAAIKKTLNELDSESKYFDYIAGSFKTEKAANAQNNMLSEEERMAILAAINGNDHTEEKLGPERDDSMARSEKEQLTMMSFALKTDTDKTYEVSFDSNLNPEDMVVKIIESNGSES